MITLFCFVEISLAEKKIKLIFSVVHMQDSVQVVVTVVLVEIQVFEEVIPMFVVCWWLCLNVSIFLFLVFLF